MHHTAFPFGLHFLVFPLIYHLKPPPRRPLHRLASLFVVVVQDTDGEGETTHHNESTNLSTSFR